MEDGVLGSDPNQEETRVPWMKEGIMVNGVKVMVEDLLNYFDDKFLPLFTSYIFLIGSLSTIP